MANDNDLVFKASANIIGALHDLDTAKNAAKATVDQLRQLGLEASNVNMKLQGQFGGYPGTVTIRAKDIGDAAIEAQAARSARELRARQQAGSRATSSAMLSAGGLAIGALGTAGFPALNVGFAAMSASSMGLGAGGTMALGGIVAAVTAIGELTRAGLRLSEEFKSFAKTEYEMSDAMAETRKEARAMVDLQEKESIARRGVVYSMTEGAKAAADFARSLDSAKLLMGMLGNSMISDMTSISGGGSGNANDMKGMWLAPIEAFLGAVQALNNAGAAEVEAGGVKAALKSLKDLDKFVDNNTASKLPPAVKRLEDYRKKLQEDFDNASKAGLQSAAMLRRALKKIDEVVMPELKKVIQSEENLSGLKSLGFISPSQALKNKAERLDLLDSAEGQALSGTQRSALIDKINQLYEDEIGLTDIKERNLKRAKELAKQEEDRLKTAAAEAERMVSTARSIHESLRTEDEVFNDRIKEISDLNKAGAYASPEEAFSDMMRTAAKSRKQFQSSFMGFEEYNRMVSTMPGSSKDAPSKEDLTKVEKAIEEIYGPKGVAAFKGAFKEAIAELETGFGP